MANSKKCDRCGAHYIPMDDVKDGNDSCVVILKETSVCGVGVCRKDYDLCPSCKLALQRWFNNPS